MLPLTHFKIALPFPHYEPVFIRKANALYKKFISIFFKTAFSDKSISGENNDLSNIYSTGASYAEKMMQQLLRNY